MLTALSFRAMTYTVPYSFDRFYESITLSGDHRTVANTRKDRVVSLLSKTFEILDSFASGSIPRYTAVSGYADLDVIVILHYGKHIKDRKPSQVLQAVRDALGEYRPGVRKNGQAVTLRYKSWPNVDIVPVSRVVNDDRTISHYNVPDMNREVWIHSRPKSHSSNVISRATSFGPEFRRIIKMIKWWNHQHSNLMQSYHIEVLALKILIGAYSDYSWDVYQFFKQAHELTQSSLWHDGSYADGYLDYFKRQEVLKRLKTAEEKSLHAWAATYGARDDHKTAIGLWRQVFGDKFPAYG